MTQRVATGTIARWIDADTLVASELDLGWGVALRDDPRRQTTHIRLVGVNAPDSKSTAPWYDPVLKTAGTAYVNAAYPPGTPIVVTSYELDSFGRSLAAVQVAGEDITVDLLRTGYVRTGDYPTPPQEA